MSMCAATRCISRRDAVLSVALLMVMLAACQPQPESTEVSASSTARPLPAPVTAPTPADPATAETAMSQVPELRIATLDGSQYDLAAHRGKWVVVNFWATWCAPCLKEMPELSALTALHEHIEVIGLAYEDIEVSAMREFLEKHPVVYPIAIVDTYDPPQAFDTPRGLPMTYLIAPDGTVADKFLGPITARDIETAIAAAGGPAVDEAGPDESS